MQSNQVNVAVNESARPSVPVKAPKFNLRLKQPDYWNTPSPENEVTLLRHWSESHLTESLRSARFNGPSYWLLDGPPYANGDAHLGHLLNKTLKDVNARFANLTGHDVTWRSGWDTHGLPLELAVEKRKGPGAKEDAKQFMSQCREEASLWQKTQAESMSRVGLLSVMNSPWMTMDPQRESTSLNLLLDLWKSGLLVERHSPVHWCPACQSALAASELEKTTKDRLEAFFAAALTPTSTAALKEFAKANDRSWPEGSLSLLSWTTTPWTLWANAGFGYPLAGPVTVAKLASGHRVLLAVRARDRLATDFPTMFDDFGVEYDGAVDFADFSELSLAAWSPLTQLSSPLLPAPFASEVEGSGFVHLAPAFGPDDFVMHETQNVRLDCHVSKNGRLVNVEGGVEMPESLMGKTLDEASVASCAMLSASGMLVHEMVSKVETNMCWRHKKPVFYRASQQWALDLHMPFEGCMEGLAARATSALDATTFLPDEKAKTPLRTMLATRRFWTLSRDRLWGLPLPFFRHAETGVLHPDTEQMWESLVVRVKSDGVECWQLLDTPDGYVKSTQTVDVWFDSGAAWLSASENGRTEADLAVEGQDQTRGWFLSSFLLHAFKNPLPPFKAVMTHSFVVDEKGLKFSKSKGGTPDHKALFAKTGADVFRYWVCSQNVGEETKWSKTALQQASQDVKDWRSFLRFQLGNMASSPDAKQPEFVRPLDMLAMSKLSDLRTEYLKLMRAGRFNHALAGLTQFRQWASAEWFDLSKRTLYCAKSSDVQLQSAQWSLQQAFLLVSQMLSVFLPFATEEAYLAWPDHPQSSLFVHVLSEFNMVMTEDATQTQSLLVWRRSLLPLVEKARELVGKGTPVSLVLPEKLVALHASLGSLSHDEKESALREWFPGCFVRLSEDDSVLETFEKQTFDEGNVFAGKSKMHYQPYRCDRCRGYFSASLNSESLCKECESEMA
jgi:isoleucyl-tRNA synthetase